MPPIFELFGLCYFFESDEHLPIHIHIKYGDNDAKIEIATRKVIRNRGLNPQQLRQAQQIVEMFEEDIIQAWHEYFDKERGGKNRLMTEKIVKLWFSDSDIYILTNKGKEYRKALEFFPALKEATPYQRLLFKIGKYREDVHWEELDEDIHISNIIEDEEPLIENHISEVFHKFPVLNVPEVARTLNMHPTKLYKYIYGVYTPSTEEEKEILDALREIGRQLANL